MDYTRRTVKAVPSWVLNRRENEWKMSKLLSYALRKVRWPYGSCARLWIERSGDPFLEGPEKVSHQESHNKISNLMTTERFYSHILNMNGGFLHTRSFRRIQISVFRYRLSWLCGPEKFPGLSSNGPLAEDIVLCSWARHLTVTVPISTQLYKWVPAKQLSVS